jgi:hypothetical protein
MFLVVVELDEHLIELNGNLIHFALIVARFMIFLVEFRFVLGFHWIILVLVVEHRIIGFRFLIVEFLIRMLVD